MSIYTCPHCHGEWEDSLTEDYGEVVRRAEAAEAEVERLTEERNAAIKALGGEGRLRGQAEAEVKRLEGRIAAMQKVIAGTHDGNVEKFCEGINAVLAAKEG